MPPRKLYTQSGLYAQVKSDRDYAGKNSVLKALFSVFTVTCLMGGALYFLQV